MERFLPTRRRIDREINKLKFAYKGEVMMGLTASYGTVSSDDTDLMLIFDNIDADATIATVKPFVGYFYRDNNCIGIRFGYSHMGGTPRQHLFRCGRGQRPLGAAPHVDLSSDEYSFGIFHRSYAGLDPKGRFGLFAEFELALSTGHSSFAYDPDHNEGGAPNRTYNDKTQVKLAFNPGAAVCHLPQRLCDDFVRAGRHTVYEHHPEGCRRQQDRFTQGFEHAFPAQYRGHQLRYDDTFVGQEKAVNYEIPTHTLSAAALLLAASCIENDLPYPTIELSIRSIEGEGFTVTGISLVNRTVTLTLDEKTDIRKVTIDKAEFDVATSNPMMTDKEKFISQIRTSAAAERGVRPAGAALYVTLSLYQDYEWTIVAEQPIARSFTVAGQIGSTLIDTQARTATAYVAEGTDLKAVTVTSLKLGPADITAYSPTAEELFRHGLRNGSSGRRHLPRAARSGGCSMSSPPT
ncbi:MAG: hypothetical protein ACLUQ6_03915 [Alistipes onderdonkii]